MRNHGAPINRGRQDAPPPDDDSDGEEEWHGGKGRPRNPLSDDVAQACVVNSSSSDEEGVVKTPTSKKDALFMSSSWDILKTSTLEGAPTRHAVDH
eukprot:4079356-Pyramimonas_sp.AAC.1